MSCSSGHSYTLILMKAFHPFFPPSLHLLFQFLQSSPPLHLREWESSYGYLLALAYLHALLLGSSSPIEVITDTRVRGQGPKACNSVRDSSSTCS